MCEFLTIRTGFASAMANSTQVSLSVLVQQGKLNPLTRFCTFRWIDYAAE